MAGRSKSDLSSKNFSNFRIRTETKRLFTQYLDCAEVGTDYISNYISKCLGPTVITIFMESIVHQLEYLY
jgi:hypothetical protein